jgi:hypothetical protein
VAASHDDLDAVGGERLRGGHERGEILARGQAADREDIRALEEQRAAGGLGVGRGREAVVDAAGHHVGLDLQQLGELRAGEFGDGDHAPGTVSDQRQDGPLPGRVRAAVPARVAQHRGVVDDDDAAPAGDRREVRRAQQRPHAGRTRRQHELLPGVPGAVHEPRRRA